MKKLTHLLKKYWFLALLASGFMVAEVYVDLYQPRMMQLIVDEGILGMSSNGVSNLNLVISTGIRMLLIVLLGGLCGIGSALFTNVTGQSYGNDIRKACFEKVMRFSFEQTDDFSTGSLITRITNDVTQLQQLVMQLIRGLVRCLMFFVGGTAALLSLDLSFGVIAACAFPLILIDIVFVVWRTNPLFTVLQESLDKLNGIIQENVAGIRVVKAFVQEKREKERFDEANRHLVDTQFNVQMMLSFLRPVMNIVLNIAIVGILYVGSVQVRQGTVGPGMVMAAITYISQILNGMMMLAMIFQTLSRGLASWSPVGSMLSCPSSVGCWASISSTAAQHLSGDRTRGDAGCHRCHRLRKNHAGEPDSPLLRRNRGACAGGRSGRPLLRSGCAAGEGHRMPAKERALLHHDPRQHRHREARRL